MVLNVKRKERKEGENERIGFKIGKEEQMIRAGGETGGDWPAE